MPGDALVPAGGVESLLATLAEVRSSAHALLAPRPQPHLQSQMLAASTATKALQRLAATLPDPTPAQTTVLADNTVEIRTLRQQLQGASAWAAGVARQAALLEQEVRTQAEQAFAGEPSAKLLRAGLETWTSKAMDQWLQAEAHRVPDLSLELCSATANTGRIRFRLGQIMHGHLLVRHLSTGLAIEQVVFRGLGEVLETNSPWTPSVHAVFRQISIHATAAALYHTNQHAGDALSLYFVRLTETAGKVGVWKDRKVGKVARKKGFEKGREKKNVTEVQTRDRQTTHTKCRVSERD